MDNNILACDHDIGQLYELSKTAYKIDLNQGLDVWLVDKHVAGILAKYTLSKVAGMSIVKK